MRARSRPSSQLTRLPYPVTGTSFTAGYLFQRGVYWFAVAAVKHGVAGSLSNRDSVVPLLDNPDYHEVAGRHLSGGAPDLKHRSALLKIRGGGSGSALFLARAFIAKGDWISDLFADRDGFSSQPYAPSRAHLAWDPKTGKIGLNVQPTCPLGHGCKIALDIEVTGTSIPVPKECGFPVPTCGHFTHNKIGVSGGGGAAFIAFQLADSYASIPGSGIAVPGAIDGYLNIAEQGQDFRATLHSDEYPSWEVLRIPRYTVNVLRRLIERRDRFLKELAEQAPRNRQ